MSKKRLRTTSPASRHTPEYWRGRLFKNVFTYKGRRVQVRAWSVKIQLFGRRKTFTLRSPDPAKAASEACSIYQNIIEHGWQAVTSYGGRAALSTTEGFGLVSPTSTSRDVAYWKSRLIHRKYLESSSPASDQEFSICIEHARISHYFPLGTNDEAAAAGRAVQIHRMVIQQGWPAALAQFPYEISIAFRWQDNPLAWTYLTLHTVSTDLRAAAAPVAGDPLPRCNIAFIEPDPNLRRTLAWHANAQRQFCCKTTFASVAEALQEFSLRPLGLVFVNHDLPEEAEAARLEELSRLHPELAVLSYSVFEDADQLFKSTPGGSVLYMLKRTPPDRWWEPLEGLTETPTRERIAAQVSKYFQHWAAQLPSGPPVWKLARLTPREHEILDLLSKGDLVKEIAAKLGLSNWTVQGHVKKIFEKLKVHTRTEAVVKYLQK